jgi:hypothetical protein
MCCGNIWAYKNCEQLPQSGETETPVELQNNSFGQTSEVQLLKESSCS